MTLCPSDGYRLLNTGACDLEVHSPEWQYRPQRPHWTARESLFRPLCRPLHCLFCSLRIGGRTLHPPTRAAGAIAAPVTRSRLRFVWQPTPGAGRRLSSTNPRPVLSSESPHRHVPLASVSVEATGGAPDHVTSAAGHTCLPTPSHLAGPDGAVLGLKRPHHHLHARRYDANGSRRHFTLLACWHDVGSRHARTAHLPCPWPQAF